jgi:hypothetical protein
VKSDKMQKAMGYLKQAMSCLEGDMGMDKDEEGDETASDDEAEESDSSSDDMDAGRSMLRRRLEKYA